MQLGLPSLPEHVMLALLQFAGLLLLCPRSCAASHVKPGVQQSSWVIQNSEARLEGMPPTAGRWREHAGRWREHAQSSVVGCS